MSGKEERPIIMPRCKCDYFITWAVKEGIGSNYLPIMAVNLSKSDICSYGKWNMLGCGKEYIMSRAVRMQCTACGKLAPYKDFLKVLELFKRECWDC